MAARASSAVDVSGLPSIASKFPRSKVYGIGLVMDTFLRGPSANHAQLGSKTHSFNSLAVSKFAVSKRCPCSMSASSEWSKLMIYCFSAKLLELDPTKTRL